MAPVVATIQRILCPTDFSDCSEHAFAHALSVARAYRASITLLHVAPDPLVLPEAMGGVFFTVSETDRQALVEELKRFARRTAPHDDVSFAFDVAVGPAASTILERADSMSAGLIVLGTHGRSGFAHLLLGSVAEKVVRRSSHPVMTIPKASGAAALAPLPYRRIVCAVDFSDCSMKGLEFATAWAADLGAHLTVVHVIEWPPDLPHDEISGARSGPGLLEYVAALKADRTARVQAALPAQGSVVAVVTTGKAYAEILRVVREERADLLVTGTHGHGAVDRLFFGSTAQHLVRQATCPVVTIRE